MNITLAQIIGVVAMLGIAIALVFAYRKYLAVNSKRRLVTMLESVGLDPALASSGEIESIMGDVRRRCQSCSSEDVCERWLAGDARGDNEFCPNSKVFSILKQYSGTAG